MIGALASPLLRWAAVAVVMAGLGVWLRFEQQARAAAVVARATAESHARAVEAGALALSRAVAEERARADRAEQIRRTVRAAPDSRACADSLPVRAALDGLRRGPGAAGPAAGAADLPRRP
jgi:hypothetical protein